MRKYRPLLRIWCVGIGLLVITGCTTSAPSASTSTTPLTPGGEAVAMTPAPTGSATSPQAPSVSGTLPLQNPATTSSVGASTITTESVSPPSEAQSTGDLLTKASDLASDEAVDQAAIEAQWVRFWRIYPTLFRSPQAEWVPTVGEVAVEPTVSQVIADATDQVQRGLEIYGDVGHDVSFVESIAGKSIATLADCQDQSHFGSMNAATGEKLTVGVAKDAMRATFSKGSDAVWRVQQIYYLDTPC